MSDAPARNWPDPESRRTRSRTLCRLLSDRVAEVASPGLGHLERSWQLVEEPSKQLLDALARWEATGEEPNMDRAKAEALRVLEAWKEADREARSIAREIREEVPA